MAETAPTRSLARRLLCLLPPLRAWFEELDRLASDARIWRTVRPVLEAEKIISASRHIITDAEQAPIIDLLSHLTPRRSVGFGKLRLGRDGDGGYVMLDDFADVSAALSFGIGRDCSWDAAIAARAIDVDQYDHTVDGSPTANPRFRFFKKKIAAAASDDSEFAWLCPREAAVNRRPRHLEDRHRRCRMGNFRCRNTRGASPILPDCRRVSLL